MNFFSSLFTLSTLILILMTLLPIGASVGFYLLDTKTKFHNLSYVVRQIIFGVVFGLIAIFLSEFGIDTGIGIINARDSGPICAGLLFGGPAGIIAACMAALERALAVLWGASETTMVACVVSTLVSGIVAAIVRKFMFDNKTPSALLAAITAIVCTVLHLTLVFITNFNNPYGIYEFLVLSWAPMISAIVFAVTISTTLIHFIAKKSGGRVENAMYARPSKKLRIIMLICVVIAFIITEVIDYVLLLQVSNTDAEEDLSIAVNDVADEIKFDIGTDILIYCNTSYKAYKESIPINDIKEGYDVECVAVINSDGIVVESTMPEEVGANIDGIEKYKLFRDILGQTDKDILYSNTTEENDVKTNTLCEGINTEDGGIFSVTYGDKQMNDVMNSILNYIARFRHIGEEGFIAVVDKDDNVVSILNDRTEETLSDFNIEDEVSPINYINGDRIRLVTINAPEMGSKYARKDNGKVEVYMYSKYVGGYTVIGFYPYEEAIRGTNIEAYLNTFIEILIFALLFALLYFFIKYIVTNNIIAINETLSRITKGDCDKYEDSEFSSLSEEISRTVDTLKEYTEIATRKQEEELEFARNIQLGALPHDIEPFVNGLPFEVYATMNTAKEVGGDFYDHFVIDNEKIAFLIADVSGKGIPAAMFMMNAKTLIKAYVESGCPVNEALMRANNSLCENNSEDMFVTAWLGVLELESGKLEYVNAGHNKPLIKKTDGSFEYINKQPNIFLAAKPDTVYRKHKVRLSYGDVIYLYTDGVTEANNAEGELYGEDRLRKVLNDNKELNMRGLLRAVRDDLDQFVNGQAQFDDITMLGLYYGEKN